mmetsp:Transcript_17235/g.36361  ORF Transcript_17235/g.36361 Transcript_17235/m.36361 type:complete len:354 (+) Transcript_17235:42-1103(+)
MIFSSLLIASVLASTEAFSSLSSSLHRNNGVAPATQLHSYLDSLGGGTTAPTSFGQMVTATDDGGITDICAFDAASSAIKSQIASGGAISASEIHDRIAQANEVVAIIRHHFPGALGSSEILRRVRSVLDGYGVENILLTQSVCPDEINHEHGDITDLFIENIGGGKVFHLGGLAGVPFTGKTGFGAYSAHVAEGGHAFVLQAPHIGMSDELQLGKYSREGQSSAGSACGAAVGAMCHCAAGNPMPDLAGATDDYQMNFLIHEIGKRMGALQGIADENAKQAELARQTSDIGRGMLNQILSTNFGDESSMLFVFTGIQINMPFDFEDYFQPLSFEVWKKDGSVVNLFNEAFGA